jgi:hypothetical protein
MKGEAMTDKMTVQKLAGEFQRAYDRGERDRDSIHRAIEKYGPDLTMAALDLYRERVNFDAAETVANNEREIAQLEQEQALLDGLPKGTTLDEAAKIRAAEGNPFAKRVLAELNSREYRLTSALFVAAVDLHPGWRNTGDGEFKKDKGAPEPPQLVEWLYKNHPEVARRIEAEFNRSEKEE